MAGNDGVEEDDDDYMGDLSIFLPPPEVPTSSSSKKRSGSKSQTPSISKTKIPKTLNWQEKRKLERERKQREEDEQTLAGLESAIPESNVGFKMLKNMGYNPGSTLGKDGAGRLEPVGLEIRRSREGLGAREEAKRRERIKMERARYKEERKQRSEEELVEEFGFRKKNQWRGRLILGDYRKAEAALAQLENREIVEPEKNDGDEEKTEDDEEEEEITVEVLNEILLKLRDEHRYCLYCGCQYESSELLQSDCPGLDRDDH